MGMAGFDRVSEMINAARHDDVKNPEVTANDTQFRVAA